jgi:hypothetical protein
MRRCNRMGPTSVSECSAFFAATYLLVTLHVKEGCKGFAENATGPEARMGHGQIQTGAG